MIPNVRNWTLEGVVVRGYHAVSDVAAAIVVMLGLLIPPGLAYQYWGLQGFVVSTGVLLVLGYGFMREQPLPYRIVYPVTMIGGLSLVGASSTLTDPRILWAGLVIAGPGTLIVQFYQNRIANSPETGQTEVTV